MHHWAPKNSYHRRPPHEDSQSRAIWDEETNKKNHLKGGDIEKSPVEKKGEIHRKRAKWVWVKQSKRHTIQNNGYNDGQGTQRKVQGILGELQGT